MNVTNGDDLVQAVQDRLSLNDGNGITKREYFAALAMAGFATKEASQTPSGPGAAALYAVKFADALIEALNKTEAKRYPLL